MGEELLKLKMTINNLEIEKRGFDTTIKILKEENKAYLNAQKIVLESKIEAKDNVLKRKTNIVKYQAIELRRYKRDINVLELKIKKLDEQKIISAKKLRK